MTVPDVAVGVECHCAPCVAGGRDGVPEPAGEIMII